MKEKNRKCFKCGSSPAKSGVNLYRFPCPGKNNTHRCALWAKYLFPKSTDMSWSSQEFQIKVYKEHIMLCNKHFPDSSFVYPEGKKLHRQAAPDEKCDEILNNETNNPEDSNMENLELPEDDPFYFLIVENNDPLDTSNAKIENKCNSNPVGMEQIKTSPLKFSTCSKKTEKVKRKINNEDKPIRKHIIRIDKIATNITKSNPLITTENDDNYLFKNSVTPPAKASENYNKILKNWTIDQIIEKTGDEFDAFGKYISLVLRSLPKELAVDGIINIQNVITDIQLRVAKEKEQSCGVLSSTT